LTSNTLLQLLKLGAASANVAAQDIDWTTAALHAQQVCPFL
jgi:hypothetical protein